jgi:hypothetical protein
MVQLQLAQPVEQRPVETSINASTALSYTNRSEWLAIF